MSAERRASTAASAHPASLHPQPLPRSAPLPLRLCPGPADCTIIQNQPPRKDQPHDLAAARRTGSTGHRRVMDVFGAGLDRGRKTRRRTGGQFHSAGHRLCADDPLQPGGSWSVVAHRRRRADLARPGGFRRRWLLSERPLHDEGVPVDRATPVAIGRLAHAPAGRHTLLGLPRRSTGLVELGGHGTDALGRRLGRARTPQWGRAPTHTTAPQPRRHPGRSLLGDDVGRLRPLEGRPWRL